MSDLLFTLILSICLILTGMALGAAVLVWSETPLRDFMGEDHQQYQEKQQEQRNRLEEQFLRQVPGRLTPC